MLVKYPPLNPDGELVSLTYSNGITGDAVLLTVLNGLLEIWTVMGLSISYHYHHLLGTAATSLFESLRAVRA